jgi:hypothetical protein
MAQQLNKAEFPLDGTQAKVRKVRRIIRKGLPSSWQALKS